MVKGINAFLLKNSVRPLFKAAPRPVKSNAAAGRPSEPCGRPKQTFPPWFGNSQKLAARMRCDWHFPR